MCPPAGKDVIPQKSNANSYKIREKREFAQHFYKFIPLPRADTWVRPYERSGSLSLKFVTLTHGSAPTNVKQASSKSKNGI